MPWTAPQVARTDPPRVNGERAALQSWLDYHRATLLFKCQGLTGDQLVIRHMAEVERGWFRRGFAIDAGPPPLYYSDEDPDGDFEATDPAQAEADFAIYLAECALADEAVRDRSLDDTLPGGRGGSPIDLRWVYLHMIEEYARHNGHADLLRERIDGVTGD